MKVLSLFLALSALLLFSATASMASFATLTHVSGGNVQMGINLQGKTIFMPTRTQFVPAGSVLRLPPGAVVQVNYPGAGKMEFRGPTLVWLGKDAGGKPAFVSDEQSEPRSVGRENANVIRNRLDRDSKLNDVYKMPPSKSTSSKTQNSGGD
ncbi:MAG: hypothetical protein EA425_14785 [Puniceicoccaceae bacterium]|nr:MAG: hypothetical protein EA425_14785 [Puniceicoccaceae bacterium]